MTSVSTPKRDSEFASICGKDFSKLDNSDLLSHFKKLYVTLQCAKGTGALPEIKPMLTNLTSRSILENPMKEIRVTAACILCEVFRHCLPTHPFTSQQVCRIFQLFIQELKELENTSDDIFSQRVVMLQSLSQNSTCATLIDALVQVSDNSTAIGDRGEDEDMLLDLFSTALSTVNSQTDKTVFELLGDILVTCIFEMEDRGVPEALLEVLLKPLVPELRNENMSAGNNIEGNVISINRPPPSYKLVKELILFCGRNFINSICNFINDILSERKDYSNSEIKNYLYPIIYELHLLGSTKEQPEDYVFKIMGNLKSHLRIDDEGKRLQCVALLGKMFSESTRLSKTHSEIFKLFAQRFLDKSAKVRIEMIKCCMQIQQNVPHLRSELLARISEKLEDQSPAVRIVAVDSMCTIAINNVERLPVTVFRKLVTRKDDKKFDIANSAIIGLSRIFERYISSQWPDDWDPTLGTSSLFIAFPVETRERLSNIPGAIISCFGKSDSKNIQHIAYRMFNEKILPKRASQRVRAQIFVSCYRSLDDQQISCLKSGLKRIVKFRAMIARCIASRKKLKALNAKAFAEMTTASSASTPGNYEFDTAKRRVTAAMEQSFNILSQYLPDEKTGKVFYQKLFSSKDEKIFKILSSISDPTKVEGCDFSKSSDKLKQYLAKSLVGQLKGTKVGSANAKKMSKYFYDFFRMLTTKFVLHSHTSIGEISNIARLCYDDNDIGKATNVLQLISLLSIDAEQPKLISFCVSNMALMMSSKNVYIAETSLRTISKLIHIIDVDILSKCMTSNAQKCLLSYCSNAGGTKHAKYAIRILAVVQKTTVGDNSNGSDENDENRKARLKFWDTILKDLTSNEKLSVRNMYLDAVLMSLATCLDSLPSNVFKQKLIEKVHVFIDNHCTPRPGQEKRSIQPTLQSSVQVGAIKWLCNKLMNSPYRKKEINPMKLKDEAKLTINTFRRFVRDSTDDNVRLAAGFAMLKVACDTYLEQFIDVRSWSVLGLLTRDKDEDISDRFSKRLVKLLSQRKLKKLCKWGSLVVLRSLATDKGVRDDGQEQLNAILACSKKFYSVEKKKTSAINDSDKRKRVQQSLQDL